MLYDLMNYDLTGIDLRRYPRTEALMDQITSSMGTVQKFWYERLRNGSLSSMGSDWEGVIPSDILYEDYIKFAEAIGERYRLTNSQFGKELKKMCSLVKPRKLKAKDSYQNERCWHRCFPSLGECRKIFESIVKLEIDWDEDTE